MADKTGYIGRNPNDSAVTVARQFFTASGVTTAFTFESGYLTGYLDVYVDGVKKRVTDEFTATDGSTFDVLQGGVSAGSTVEAVAFKAFNAAAISGDITGNFDVSGNTTLGGSLDVSGATTLNSLTVSGSTTLGAGTSVGFANTAFNIGGTPDISVDLLSAVDINVSGAATIGGVLTYEDVTNIDSIGIVTARTGVEVTANGLVVNAGVSTLAADLSIADKIVHTGDTNTAIRFPSTDTITAETAGVERLRIDSTGDVGLVGIATATGLVVVAGSGIYAGHTGVVTAVTFDGNLTGNVTGNVTGNADTATTSTNVTVADESSDTSCNVLFTTAATGNLPPKSGTNLTFNSSSGALTATSFVGDVVGNVDGNVSGNVSGGTVAGSTGTFTGDVDIADKIVHTGDTNTAIRFPAADTFTVETAGNERLRIDSAGKVLINSTADSNATMVAKGLSNDLHPVIKVRGVDANGYTFLGDEYQTDESQFTMGLMHSSAAVLLGWGVKPSNTANDTYLSTQDSYATKHSGVRLDVDGLRFLSNSSSQTVTTDAAVTLTERLLITPAGLVGINTTPGTLLELQGASGKEATVTFNREGAQGSNDGVIGELLFENATDSVAQISVKRESAADDAYVQFATQATGGGLTERLRITSAGKARIPDNGKFTCGAGDDLEIYHDGTTNRIDAVSGNLHIKGSNLSLKSYLDATANGAVEIYYDNVKKFETTSDGVTVTGGATLTATAPAINFTAGGSAVAQAGQILVGENSGGGDLLLKTKTTGGTLTTRLTVGNDGTVNLPDNGKLTAGAGDDLEIYHDGSHSYISDTGTGYLLIKGSEIQLQSDTGEDFAKFQANGSVELYYDNSKKLETTSSGVTVTGTVSDSIGSLRRLGVNSQSGAYTLVAADAGKAVTQSTNSAAVTVPNSVFTAGDMVTVINNTGTNINLTQGTGVTMYNTADAATGTRTLAQRGAATLLFTSASVAYVSGAGLS